MATITRENIAPLNDKLVVTLKKEDYLPAVDKSIKNYAKTANIQGFRKGMVPAGLIRKMYGPGIFQDEVLKTVDNELNKYIAEEKLAILAQPIALEQKELELNFQDPKDYNFEFEIGLQPEVNIDPKSINVTRYQIEVTDQALEEELERLRQRYGNYTTPETIEDEKTIISAEIAIDGQEPEPAAEGEEPAKPTDTAITLKDIAKGQQKEFKGKKIGDKVTVQLDKAFKGEILERVLGDLKLDKTDKENGKKTATLTITKIGFLEEAPLDEKLFDQVYPGKDIKTEEDFKTAIKADIEKYYAQQASGQIHDQIYHYLTDHVSLDMPEPFLKRWMKVSSEGKKTDEDIDKDIVDFKKQLQWALISSKLSNDNEIKVENEELKDFARHQLMSYLGGQMSLQGNEAWIEDYVNKMMGDRKFIEDAHGQVRIGKLFEALETQVTAKDQPIAEKDFTEMVQKHQHEHHH
ncbi:trigger factor [Arachidicoccus terrestris]|uniref:trigger factor n=1 Tax=Arachidicoccus terrestris TaxID=2875539 RepID=UPI001CC5F6CF|nr:trigger factor [Arachidicoccus terrestris]UAY54932.1 trigger factor [Arachidicoccus terrestris]